MGYNHSGQEDSDSRRARSDLKESSNSHAQLAAGLRHLQVRSATAQVDELETRRLCCGWTPTFSLKNHWLQVRLQGVSDNRQGIGARVAVLRKSQTALWRRAHTDGSYLSAHDSRVHFGLGPDANLQGVVVHWPGGTREVFEGIKPDTIVTLRQQAGRPYEGKVN